MRKVDALVEGLSTRDLELGKATEAWARTTPDADALLDMDVLLQPWPSELTKEQQLQRARVIERDATPELVPQIINLLASGTVIDYEAEPPLADAIIRNFHESHLPSYDVAHPILRQLYEDTKLAWDTFNRLCNFVDRTEPAGTPMINPQYTLHLQPKDLATRGVHPPQSISLGNGCNGRNGTTRQVGLR